MLYDQDAIPQDVVDVCDEMYLKKKQYNSVHYVGADAHGNLFSDYFVFVIDVIKKNIPVVFEQVTNERQWRSVI